MGFARLDHIIVHVPDIQAAHRALLDRGFEEAWPIGPFWPRALTSGIAVGGLNLELLQPSDAEVTTPYAETLVFEPTSLEDATADLAAAGIPVRRFEKVEPDPDLLRLRGFSEVQTPQKICTNLFPAALAPLDFFVCDYAPFLRARLAPDKFAAREGAVTAIEAQVLDPLAASNFLAKMAYAGIPIEFEAGSASRVTALRFGGRSRLEIQTLE
ncbi:MAG: VOC family protein [Fimbriimonas sp.]